MKIVFIGLGRMGFPMAGHLATANLDITVFNRSLKKSKEWSSIYNKPFSDSLSNLPSNIDLVITCLKDDDALSEILMNKHLLAKMNPNGCIVDHSTTSKHLVLKLFSKFTDVNINFYDAPVSGGEAGAINGQLSVMVGGEEDCFATTKTILDNYSKAIEFIGPSGSGQLTKMVNQICITGVIKSLSEAIHFAQAQESLDLNKVFNAISGGAAQSWQLDNRFHSMVEGKFDFGFGIDLMIKDLKIAIAEAETQGIQLDTVKSILDDYVLLSEKGGGNQDTSSLIKSIASSN